MRSQLPLNSHGWESNGPSCPDAQISCQNTSVVDNLCCFNAPGGQMLQTQFWDVSPPTGPSDAWTIHGLWPDLCDGSYDANCDDSRTHSNISAILSSFGADDILSEMSTYWKDYHGNDQSLWYHEWNKHGTCVSTLNPSCYDNYQATEEVVDYFSTTVKLYKSLDTYNWLKDAGIVPSTSQTYTRDQIQNVLSSHHGMPVTLGCHSGVFNEVWYHFDVKGSLQTGDFIAADPLGGKNTCPATGIRYPFKGSSGKPTGTATTGLPGPTGAPRKPFEGKGFLAVETGGTSKGCIIGSGSWYSSGSCATFTATAAGDKGFTLASRKGKCAVKKDALKCAAEIREPTVFESAEGLLSFDGNTAFYADSLPRGWKQIPVYVNEGNHMTDLTIQWQSV
ncbi:ribonuclease M [Delphinella strobiligena]|nr:ribonuclease M [Delphinella strobiligena]